jgi:hypothetical protein
MLDASLDPLLAVFSFDHQLSNFVHRLLLHAAAAGGAVIIIIIMLFNFWSFCGINYCYKRNPRISSTDLTSLDYHHHVGQFLELLWDCSTTKGITEFLQSDLKLDRSSACWSNI